MSYREAREALTKNSTLIDARANPREWNTNAALANLVDALDNDLSQIQDFLHRILQKLQHLR